MFEDIIIQKEPPRSSNNLKVSFGYGLRAYAFFGFYFFVGSLSLFAFTLIKTHNLFPTVIILLFGLIGFYWLQKYYKQVKLRKTIFENGTAVYTEVMGHGRKFTIFKSSKNCTLIVKPINSTQSITLVFPNKKIWQSAPVGNIIIGLNDKQNYFFAEEIGYHFKIA